MPVVEGIQTYDRALKDAYRYCRQARRQVFRIAWGFAGIAPAPSGELVEWLERELGLKAAVTFLRQSPAGQIEPNFIHCDKREGDWTAILYLNPVAPKGDGTDFWRAKSSGAVRGEPMDEFKESWERWEHVEGIFGRVLVFPSDFYHSRAIEANYGAGNDARLIQVVFGVNQ